MDEASVPQNFNIPSPENPISKIPTIKSWGSVTRFDYNGA